VDTPKNERIVPKDRGPAASLSARVKRRRHKQLRRRRSIFPLAALCSCTGR
jgi:hypothetical protein